ncbi:kinesin-like protein KIF3B [Sycon ciliatum]|uniref:kinesin-like protein KIF3B n=1 Tax=Sycon ciliatum TaxID=27933 RepID=UPI0031F6C00F
MSEDTEPTGDIFNTEEANPTIPARPNDDGGPAGSASASHGVKDMSRGGGGGGGATANDDGEEEEEEVDGAQDPEMYSMMVGGLYELDQALQESGKLLEAKEKELQECLLERNRLKEVMAKEILRKTELSSLLEDSRQHVIALEVLIEKWQEEVRQVKQKEEVTRTQLADTTELLKQAHEDAAEAKSESAATAKENDTLKGRVKELKKMLEDGDQLLRKNSSTGSSAEHTEQDMNWAFLKSSVLHFFTDAHPYEQAKAIVSILDFDAQDRKKIYAKLDEKFGRRQHSGSHH